jgi:hypothetical protein
MCHSLLLPSATGGKPGAIVRAVSAGHLRDAITTLREVAVAVRPGAVGVGRRGESGSGLMTSKVASCGHGKDTKADCRGYPHPVMSVIAVTAESAVRPMNSRQARSSAEPGAATSTNRF